MLYDRRGPSSRAPRASTQPPDAGRAGELREAGVELLAARGPARASRWPISSPIASTASAEVAVGHHLRGEPAQGQPLHLGVLEPPSTSCRPLRSPHGALPARRSSTGGEHLERVPELLAPLAQRVQVVGRGVRGDCRPTTRPPAGRRSRSLGRRARRRVMPGRAVVGRRLAELGQRRQRHPARTEPLEPGGSQATDQRAPLGRPAAAQVDRERRQVRGVGGDQPAAPWRPGRAA